MRDERQREIETRKQRDIKTRRQKNKETERQREREKENKNHRMGWDFHNSAQISNNFYCFVHFNLTNECVKII